MRRKTKSAIGMWTSLFDSLVIKRYRVYCRERGSNGKSLYSIRDSHEEALHDRDWLVNNRDCLTAYVVYM